MAKVLWIHQLQALKLLLLGAPHSWNRIHDTHETEISRNQLAIPYEQCFVAINYACVKGWLSPNLSWSRLGMYHAAWKFRISRCKYQEKGPTFSKNAVTMKEPHDSLLYGCLFGARKHRSLYRSQQQLLFISSFQDPNSRNMQCSSETLLFWECRKNDERALFNLFLSYIDHWHVSFATATDRHSCVHFGLSTVFNAAQRTPVTWTTWR